MSRHRGYGFTWNNYPENFKELLQNLYSQGKVKYLIAGEEIAPTTGTPHLQGQITLKTNTSMSALQKHLQTYDVHLSLKSHHNKQHDIDNMEYCKKDGKFFELGEPPSQGKRNDLKAFMDDVENNPNRRKLDRMKEFPEIYCKYPKFCNEFKLLSDKYETLDWKDPPNIWVWGPPGVGKSRQFQELVPPPFMKQCNKWWDGYDHQDDVLIEDMEPNHECLSWYLKIWADRYPFQCEMKGYSVCIRPKRIIVTSNFHPSEIFKSQQVVDALYRRFDIRHMT